MGKEKAKKKKSKNPENKPKVWICAEKWSWPLDAEWNGEGPEATERSHHCHVGREHPLCFLWLLSYMLNSSRTEDSDGESPVARKIKQATNEHVSKKYTTTWVYTDSAPDPMFKALQFLSEEERDVWVIAEAAALEVVFTLLL